MQLGLDQNEILHREGERYSLWQRINGSWLIERSFSHAFFHDPAVWTDIRKSQEGCHANSSNGRPYAVFHSSFDPNTNNSTTIHA